MKVLFKMCIVASSALLLSGCAGFLPLPGGKSTTNDEFYESSEDMTTRLETLQTGMTLTNALAHMDRKEEELTKLNRQEVLAALYGGLQSPYAQGFAANPYTDLDIKSLSGYKIDYKIVNRKHGLKSPISIRTDEKGFHYTAVMIFKDGLLYEEPIVSGGLVDTSSSSTVFDYLNPGIVMKRVGM